jgi:hypothetical protein
MNAAHLYHLVRGHPLFGDRQGGYGGLWEDTPFEEAAACAAWMSIRPLFLPWWNARFPDLLPWAEWAFLGTDADAWRRWEWDTAQHGRLLDQLREFLATSGGQS